MAIDRDNLATIIIETLVYFFIFKAVCMLSSKISLTLYFFFYLSDPLFRICLDIVVIISIVLTVVIRQRNERLKQRKKKPPSIEDSSFT